VQTRKVIFPNGNVSVQIGKVILLIGKTFFQTGKMIFPNGNVSATMVEIDRRRILLFFNKLVGVCAKWKNVKAKWNCVKAKWKNDFADWNCICANGFCFFANGFGSAPMVFVPARTAS
jgi:hypothetical protein